MRLDQLFRSSKYERVRQAFVLVSPTARLAIEQEVIPQIDGLVTSPEVASALCQEVKTALTEAFHRKDETYTRLIRYKSIDQSDSQFKRDLLLSLDEWLEKTLTTLAV